MFGTSIQFVGKAIIVEALAIWEAVEKHYKRVGKRFTCCTNVAKEFDNI